MSIVSSLVLLFLVCFSFHACNARSFRVVQKETAKEFQHYKKNEKLNPAKVSIHPDMKSSIPNASRGAKAESRFEKEKVNGESNEPRMHIDQAESNRAKVSGATKKESIGSVSWRVPHKKRGEPEPGFNLDYLPPKTHPPVHN